MRDKKPTRTEAKAHLAEGENRLAQALKRIGPFLPKTNLAKPPVARNWRPDGRSGYSVS